LKALLLNGSPHTEGGVHVTMLRYLEEGLREAGAEVSRRNLYKLDIKPCLGCTSCWSRTPGRCVQDDDMRSLLPEVARSDILVLATPVYVDGMTGPTKVFLDRLVPLLEGRFEIRDGHCRHPLREGVKAGALALVSASGFTEMDNFDPLVAHVKAACRNLGREFAGAILRPYGWLFSQLRERGHPVDSVLESIRSAGVSLVETGNIPDSLLEEISRDFVAREEVVEAINSYYDQFE
jgi:multimeric flavodoxin WrbA